MEVPHLLLGVILSVYLHGDNLSPGHLCTKVGIGGVMVLYCKLLVFKDTCYSWYMVYVQFIS
jgi:hypothetical protein